MTFNGAELAAMVKLALAMAQADGYVSDEEKLAIALDPTEFGSWLLNFQRSADSSS